MDAKTKLMEYAASHNNGKTYTDEQFCGKMATEGICIDRTPMTSTIARMRREGRTIIVTETVKAENVDGKVTETTTEIMRLAL